MDVAALAAARCHVGAAGVGIATRGGAAVLGRDDIGYLAPGMSADFIALNLNQLAFLWGLHDPVAAVLLCQPPNVDYSVINGKVVVENGNLTTIDLVPHLEKHNQIAAKMIRDE